MSLWAADAIQMGQDTPAFIGHEQIGGSYKVFFETFNLKTAIYGETEVEVSGDLAFSRGTYTLSFTPKEEGPTTHIDGKWLDILKRQADGSWKIYRDCVTNNAPPKVG
jgi:ketosteroid isomerase-like protein